MHVILKSAATKNLLSFANQIRAQKQILRLTQDDMGCGEGYPVKL